MLTGLNNFNRGTGSQDVLSNSTFSLNYLLENWNDDFFANINLSHSKYHEFKSSDVTLTQNYVGTESVILDNSESWNISTKIDYFFESISSNLKLDLGFSSSSYKNIAEGNLRNITSNLYNYGIEFKSGFDGIFNYHFGK